MKNSKKQASQYPTPTRNHQKTTKMSGYNYDRGYQGGRRAPHPAHPMSGRQHSEARIANRPPSGMAEYRSPSRDNPLSFKFSNGVRSTSQQKNFNRRAPRHPDNDNVSIASSSSRNPLKLGFGDSRRNIEANNYMPDKYHRNGSNSVSVSQNRHISHSIDRNIRNKVDFRNSNSSSNSNMGFRNGHHGHHHRGYRGGGGRTREETELVRTKNKALMSVNKEKLPDFLRRLEEMKSTVQRNIKYSFTNRLRDIWKSYIRDQKLKNKPVNEEELMKELKPIEEAAVDSLNAQTDVLIQKIKLQQLSEIEAKFSPQEAEQKLDPNDPLYKLEVEFKIAKENNDLLTKNYMNAKMREDNHAFELRNKYRALMEKHIESYNREFRIKFANDNQLALNSLKQAKNAYIEKLNQMQRDMRKGGNQNQLSEGQKQTIEELKKKIAKAKRGKAKYGSNPRHY